jgi:hypothetical protein
VAREIATRLVESIAKQQTSGFSVAFNDDEFGTPPHRIKGAHIDTTVVTQIEQIEKVQIR